MSSILVTGGAGFIGANFLLDALTDVLAQAVRHPAGATVFACPVTDPRRYGVGEFDADGRAPGLAREDMRHTR